MEQIRKDYPHLLKKIEWEGLELLWEFAATQWSPEFTEMFDRFK
jgi:hypothetical protein